MVIEGLAHSIYVQVYNPLLYRYEILSDILSILLVFLVDLFDQLKMLAFKLTLKASCLWRCLVNLSIGCWLFIREKIGQQVKSQPKKLAGAAFSIWLKSQLFNCFKSHLSNIFLPI